MVGSVHEVVALDGVPGQHPGFAFLAGPGSAYVHGHVLRVDGGFGLASQSLATGG